MNWRDHIHSDPGVMLGKPVIKGTRITVELILDYLAGGASAEDVFSGYPHLPPEAVRAAVAFAHDMVVEEKALAQQRAA